MRPGRGGRCNGGGAIRAKAGAGFQMYAAAGDGHKRGGRAGRDYEVFEL